MSRKGITYADPDHHAGAGIIGSHFAQRHLEQVYIIDDLSTGTVEKIADVKNRPLLIGHKVLALQ